MKITAPNCSVCVCVETEGFLFHKLYNLEWTASRISKTLDVNSHLLYTRQISFYVYLL